MTPQSCCLVFTQRHWKRGCCLVAQSSPILCDPVDCSPPGSSVHGILQAIIPEWVAISFSRGSSQPRGWTWVSCTGRWILYCWDTREACWKPQFSSVQSLSCVRLFATPWAAAHQASLSITNSWSSPKLMSIESVMPSNHLILCRPLLLLPSIFPSIRVFSNESARSTQKPVHECLQWLYTKLPKLGTNKVP